MKEKPLPPPRKPKNQDRRTREFLYPHEITALIEEAKSSLNPQRDSTLLLLMFCHALQPIEVTSLQWQHVNFAEKIEPSTLTIYRNRRRGAYPQEFVPDIHILSSIEVKFLRQLAHEYKGATLLFPSERRHRLSLRSIHHIVSQAGILAGLEFPIHPYMLRTSGILYRAALLLRKMPSVTFRQCHLTWLRYGTFTSLTVAEKREFSAIDPSVVEAIWALIEQVREFIGVNSYNHAAKYVLQAFAAYPDEEHLPEDFWLRPPD
ncbi:MAG TPA: tyrosine-type recombinase/integrase [Candidatus Obscuribacterales bacterium]